MKKIKLISLLITISFLPSCMDAEKNKLDNRVIDYWNYKINKDFESAYDFLSPGWRSNETKDAFERRMKNSSVKWNSVKLLNKECSETFLCEVSVEIQYEYMFKGNGGEKIQLPTILNENWMMKDNVWYNVPIKATKKSTNKQPI